MICEFLKNETKHFHSEAEKAMGAVRIFDNDYSKEEYVKLLKVLYYAHYSVENALSYFDDESFKINELYNLKYNLLKNDLNNMGVQIDNSLVNNYKIDSLPKAIGSLYVLKGSEMGTAVIYKHILKFPFLKESSVEFYSFESEIFIRWKDFCLNLDTIILTIADKDNLESIKNEVLEGAKNTYLQFIHCSQIKS